MTGTKQFRYWWRTADELPYKSSPTIKSLVTGRSSRLSRQIATSKNVTVKWSRADYWRETAQELGPRPRRVSKQRIGPDREIHCLSAITSRCVMRRAWRCFAGRRSGRDESCVCAHRSNRGPEPKKRLRSRCDQPATNGVAAASPFQFGTPLRNGGRNITKATPITSRFRRPGKAAVSCH